MASNTKSATAVIRKPKQQTLRVPKLDVLKCNKCGICVEVCPQNVFIHNENGTYHVQNPERCIECGACELNCRGEAILLDPFPGCGCIWNATFRRLKGVTFWRRSASDSTGSSADCN